MKKPRMRWSNLVLVAAAMQAASPSHAQILANNAQHVWRMDAGEMTYVVGINDANALQAIYWGPKLNEGATFSTPKQRPEIASFDPPVVTTPLEYPAWGAGLPLEPAIKVSFPDGNRSLQLTYVDAKQTGDQLEITERDITAPVVVHLFYRIDPTGILARWSVIENRGKESFTIEQASSATWNLPPQRGYDLSWLTGRWGSEWQLHTEAIHPGSRVLESRRGSTSHQTNPWFAISTDSETTETAGPVWFGELGWSGNWRINVEQTEWKAIRITGGYNPFDFSYPLAPGASLETPHFYAGYTSHGHGEASRILHRFQRASILPQSPHPKPRPIIFNSWEATEFNVDEAGQIALAEKAAQVGAERMVIDDGWFGQRKTDHAGLGDWYVNKDKVPQRPQARSSIKRPRPQHGLRPLGRTRDGQPQLRPIPRPPRLGAST